MVSPIVPGITNLPLSSVRVWRFVPLIFTVTNDTGFPSSSEVTTPVSERSAWPNAAPDMRRPAASVTLKNIFENNLCIVLFLNIGSLNGAKVRTQIKKHNPHY